MNIFPTLTLADRLALTLQGLARAVAACSDRRRVGGALENWLILLIWTRVRRAEGKIQGLLRRFRAGTLRVAGSVPGEAVRQRPVARPAERPGERPGERRGGAVKGVPRRLAWLLPLVPCEAANFASQLRYLLEDPEMVALLAAAPQARRALASLCRMLGIEAAVLTPRAVARPGSDETAETSVAAAVVGSGPGGGGRPPDLWVPPVSLPVLPGPEPSPPDG